MHGNGKIIFDNGIQYDGEWQFGKKEGYGAFVFPCGMEYLGNFKNDKINMIIKREDLTAAPKIP